MNKEKRQALEAAGFVFGNAEDFLELTAEERAIVDLRLKLGHHIRALREEQNLTQAQLAHRMKTSQPRVNRIEAGSPDVSLELLLKGYYTLGGTVEVKFGRHVDPLATDFLVGRGGRIHKVKAEKATISVVKKRAGEKTRSN
jgi:transcriptional regulator with XRE-family HTH domain